MVRGIKDVLELPEKTILINLSRKKIVKSGEPKGNAFGPLLFLIYINGIVKAPKICQGWKKYVTRQIKLLFKYKPKKNKTQHG